MQARVTMLVATSVRIGALSQKISERETFPFSLSSLSKDSYLVTPACPFQLACIRGVIPVPSNSSTETPSTWYNGTCMCLYFPCCFRDEDKLFDGIAALGGSSAFFYSGSEEGWGGSSKLPFTLICHISLLIY